jgi:hypothetical protein
VRPDRDRETVAAPPPRNWRPPLLVTALSVVVVVAAGGWLAVAVGVGRATVATAAGAGLVGLFVRLASTDRFRPVGVTTAWLVSFPAGALAVAGTLLVSADQFAGTAPVGAVFVVTGLGAATLGATGLPGRPVGREHLRDATRTGVTAAIALVTTTLLPVVDAVTTRELGVSPVPFEPVVTRLVTVFLTPPTSPPPVGSFLAVVACGAVAFASLLRRLPVRALLDDGTDDPSPAVATVDRVLGVLDYGWAVLLLAGPLLVINAVASATVWERVPGSIREPLGVATATPAVRAFAIGVVAVALVVWVLVRLVRAGYRTRLGTRTATGGAAVGWLGLCWLGWRQGGGLAEAFAAAVAGALPAAAAGSFRQEFDAVVGYYGPETVGLALVTGCVVVTAGVVLSLVAGSVVGMVPASGVGHGLSAAGLFAAGGVGLAVDAGIAPSLTALVAAVVVWDLGGYGADLGGEVGRRGQSRRAVFVHLGGSLLVSAVAGGGAVLALRARSAVGLAPDAPAPVVLLAGVAALVVFALLLR